VPGTKIVDFRQVPANWWEGPTIFPGDFMRDDEPPALDYMTPKQWLHAKAVLDAGGVIGFNAHDEDQVVVAAEAAQALAHVCQFGGRCEGWITVFGPLRAVSGHRQGKV